MSRTLAKAILYVDGYNVIGFWPSLQQKLHGGGMEEARRLLIEAMINYSAYEGMDARIVFDAHYQNTPSVSETITRTLSVHYTGFGQTADTYIEKACASLAHKLRLSRRRLIVATSDRAQQLTVVGYGAESMSALQLAEAVESSNRRCLQRQQSRKRTATTSRFLVSSLDAQSQQRLAQLRRGYP
ncbi:MAG: NYN domain-containing protein [Microcoleaceae cyanobacterium]